MKEELKNLYNELLIKKENGERLNIDKITYDELYRLKEVEGVSDSMLAELFDVSKAKVRRRRYKLNIRAQDFL